MNESKVIYWKEKCNHLHNQLQGEIAINDGLRHDIELQKYMLSSLNKQLDNQIKETEWQIKQVEQYRSSNIEFNVELNILKDRLKVMMEAMIEAYKLLSPWCKEGHILGEVLQKLEEK